ncbi:hypothetical protein AURDEDRAFT_92431 [Auricularia subglabra TFB-10046 SS5]|uniref:Malate dehydrogenase n=1 Tax=Auricularia subglabra (strain TFB-10046 / SS5) TaxID=717982 RepID=J0WU66_AURST|nr:hypothetical protein AURDEDRAFT_92431 [Auricularia subglabra TFB-10046 SS5]
MRVAAAASASLFALAALASPHVSHCDVSKLSLPLPNGTTALTPPAQAGTKLKYVAVGLGVQNYTCGASGTYAYAGAVANLYDISCLGRSPLFPYIQEIAYALAEAGPKADNVLDKVLGGARLKLGEHYFVTSPSGSGISPKFDFTKAMHSSSAYVLAAKAGNMAAPTGPADVDWLQLNDVQGELAKSVYRVQTRGGQPAATCATGQFSSVPYAAQYWFYV